MNARKQSDGHTIRSYLLHLHVVTCTCNRFPARLNQVSAGRDKRSMEERNLRNWTAAHFWLIFSLLSQWLSLNARPLEHKGAIPYTTAYFPLRCSFAKAELKELSAFASDVLFGSACSLFLWTLKLTAGVITQKAIHKLTKPRSHHRANCYKHKKKKKKKKFDVCVNSLQKKQSLNWPNPRS